LVQLSRTRLWFFCFYIGVFLLKICL
jgi:hypothetical protein